MYGGGSTGIVGMVDPDPNESEVDYDEMNDFLDRYEDEENDKLYELAPRTNFIYPIET